MHTTSTLMCSGVCAVRHWLDMCVARGWLGSMPCVRVPCKGMRPAAAGVVVYPGNGFFTGSVEMTVEALRDAI
jgi:hypothetical protein